MAKVKTKSDADAVITPKLNTVKTASKQATPGFVYCVFLVQQELKKRSEQFIDIFATSMGAYSYCRKTHVAAYCKYNERYSAQYVLAQTKRTGRKFLRVNYDETRLLIKGFDFKRTDIGRTNNNPRLYWNIAQIPIQRSSK